MHHTHISISISIYTYTHYIWNTSENPKQSRLKSLNDCVQTHCALEPRIWPVRAANIYMLLLSCGLVYEAHLVVAKPFSCVESNEADRLTDHVHTTDSLPVWCFGEIMCGLDIWRPLQRQGPGVRTSRSKADNRWIYGLALFPWLPLGSRRCFP